MLVAVAFVLILLNGLTLVVAIPATIGIDSYCDLNGCTYFARDFSAYYEGAWRLLHHPDSVYHQGNATGDYPIPPNPKHFRYAPFFLLFIIPFLNLNYHDALLAFDIFQFFLLPVIAYLLYKLLTIFHQELTWKMAAVISIVLIAAIIAPIRVGVVDYTTWSWSYYWQWADGQARVLETFLILWSLYEISRKSKYSGLLFALSSFDPRFALLLLPIAIYVARKVRGLRIFIISSAVFLIALYASSLGYDNLANQFYQSIIGHNDFSFFAYEWIPFFTIVSLTVVITVTGSRKESN
jgi:hypothetical protein